MDSNRCTTSWFFNPPGRSILGLPVISEVSSLFSNAISVSVLPVIPILAVIFFHDTMDAIKFIWGFVSYVYECYLDDKSSKNQHRSSSSPLLEEVS